MSSQQCLPMSYGSIFPTGSWEKENKVVLWSLKLVLLVYDKRDRVSPWPRINLLFAVDKKCEHMEDRMCS